jgi:hypothetical protein
MHYLSSRDAGWGHPYLRLVTRNGRNRRNGKTALLRISRGVESATGRSIAERHRPRTQLDRGGLRLVPRLAPGTSVHVGADWRTIAGGIGGALTSQLDEGHPPACA